MNNYNLNPGEGKIVTEEGMSIAIYNDNGAIKKCQRFASMWVAWWDGTRKIKLGIVLAMTRIIKPPAKSLKGRPKKD